MGWLRTLLSWRDAPTPDDRPVVVDSVSFSEDIPTPIDTLISKMLGGATPRASRKEALSVPAMLRGRNMICSIATLPLEQRDADRVIQRSMLLEQIDPNVPNVVTLAQTVEDLLLDGISWWRTTARTADGFPYSAMHVDAGAVSNTPPPGYAVQTLPSGWQLPGGVLWVDGKPVRGRDMIRFDSPNPGVLDAAGRSIKRAILFEQAAALYADNGGRMLDYFTPQDGADPVDDDEIQAILDEWRAARKARATGYVPAALKYNTVETMSPADLQLAQLQKQATLDIANVLGLDAEDLQVSTTSRTYANAVDRRRDRINDVLAMYMSAITDRLSMNDVTKRGRKVGFNLDAYMKANPTERWNTYQTGIDAQIITVEEARAAEGLPAVPVEPRPRMQPPADVPPQEQRTQQEDTVSASAPMPGYVAAAATANGLAASFTAPTDGTVELAFDMDEPTAAFRVNRDKRTISGLLVPWDKVAASGGARWRFAKDSLHWVDDGHRIKLNREHDRRNPVGVAVRLQGTPSGLDGSFKIARGAAGDEVLSLAEDGVLDGFSIEVDFNDGDQFIADPNDDLVRYVQRAKLRGVAITASPAFDDARVTSVAATREGNPIMTTDTKVEPQAGAPVAPAGQQNGAQMTAAPSTGPDFSQLNDALRGLAEKMNGFAEQIGSVTEQPAVVDPTARTAQFQVTEELPYRFDGTRGEHDFSTDVIKGSKGEYDALKRVEKFIAENFRNPQVSAQAAQFAVTQANVAALNPARQRPDLYVDQLDYVRPIWDSISKGAIADNTPFVLPKFNSSSGLVGDHAEGVEPTPGALTATSQTITPSAVSGKVEVTRESWDQGGNPQLSAILWRQMVREYDEELEQAAAAHLDSLAPTTITLTTAAVDTALSQEITGALALLHFVRGGMRFRDLKLQADLYKALTNAKDADGRPLFPIIGAMNANGTVGQFFGAINLAGLVGVPAWALGASGTVSEKSYLYNREDVHGWASTPNRLQFEYRVAFVDVAIWGYKAIATTRLDGVRAIAYDPTA